jgi:hypothetical protein
MDDTVLMAESSADLQNQLNSFQDYCSIWKLKVNTDKSKVIIFSRASAYKITKSFRYIPSWISISLEIVCNPLKLQIVKYDSRKVIIFSRGKLSRNLNFSLNGEKLEIVNSLNYLGIELTRTGNFKRAKQSTAGKATVAFYEVLKMGRKHSNLAQNDIILLFIVYFQRISPKFTIYHI